MIAFGPFIVPFLLEAVFSYVFDTITTSVSPDLLVHIIESTINKLIKYYGVNTTKNQFTMQLIICYNRRIYGF